MNRVQAVEKLQLKQITIKPEGRECNKGVHVMAFELRIYIPFSFEKPGAGKENLNTKQHNVQAAWSGGGSHTPGVGDNLTGVKRNSRRGEGDGNRSGTRLPMDVMRRRQLERETQKEIFTVENNMTSLYIVAPWHGLCTQWARKGRLADWQCQYLSNVLS